LPKGYTKQTVEIFEEDFEVSAEIRKITTFKVRFSCFCSLVLFLPHVCAICTIAMMKENSKANLYHEEEKFSYSLNHFGFMVFWKAFVFRSWMYSLFRRCIFWISRN
jgi:hypothetical protein